MLGLTLLEKIEEYEKNPEKRGTWDSFKIRASVLKNLNRILNSKQGSSLASPDLGMPDFTNMPGNIDLETYRDFEKTILGVIKKYEPRLSNVKVGYKQEDNKFLSLKFMIEGDIILERSSFSVSLETIVDPEGKISVKTEE